ncbi:MAG: hypothetical protein LUI60_01455 [Clostridia bacterium]|nr:hypothetical protein [Clostridia bacterium]
MRKKRKHGYKCRYGYKVCFKDEIAGLTEYFITYTYQQALDAKNYYIRYPPLTREDNSKLINPVWVIVPITKQEVQAGIWRRCPF